MVKGKINKITEQIKGVVERKVSINKWQGKNCRVENHRNLPDLIGKQAFQSMKSGLNQVL